MTAQITEEFRFQEIIIARTDPELIVATVLSVVVTARMAERPDKRVFTGGLLLIRREENSGC